MAKIPMYAPDQVTSTASSSLERAKRSSSGITAATFGGRDAVSVVGIGREVAALAATLGRTRDTALARDSLVQARQEVSLFLFGNGKTPGLYNAKGKDAINAFEVAEKKFSDINKRYSDALPSSGAQDMFEVSFRPFLEQNSLSVLKHQATQIQAYKNDTLDADNKQAEEDAINNRNSPSVIEESEAIITANTKELFKGLEGPALETKISERVYKMYSSVLRSVMDDSPVAALGFFETYAAQGKFDPRVRSTLHREVKDKARLYESYELAKNLSASGLPLKEQLAEVDKIKDPEMAIVTRKAVRDRYKEIEYLKNEERKRLELDTWTTLYQNPGAPIPYSQLDDTQWRAMETYRDTRQSGFAANTDWQLMGELASMSPAELKSLGMPKLLTFREKLTERDWNKILTTYRQEVTGGSAIAKTGLTRIKQASTLINDTVKALDYDDKQVLQLNRTVQNQVEEYELMNGRAATPSEVQKFIDRAVLEVSIDNPYWFDPEVPFFEVAGTPELEGIYVGEAAGKDLMLIIQALEARNIPVNRENIIWLYEQRDQVAPEITE